VAGSVAQGETDLLSFVGDAWTLYTVELESVTGDADLTVYAGDTATRRLIGKSDLKVPLDRVRFSTEAVPENHGVEVYGYLASSDYGLSVRAEPLVLPEPPLPTADQFRSYVYTLSDATRLRAKAAGCFSCHAETTRVVGPSFKAISLRFKDVAGSKDRLIAKVKAGGEGSWGEIPMPPYSPRVSDADIDALVQSILFGDPAPTIQ
jgi:cytochrome c